MSRGVFSKLSQNVKGSEFLPEEKFHKNIDFRRIFEITPCTRGSREVSKNADASILLTVFTHKCVKYCQNENEKEMKILGVLVQSPLFSIGVIGNIGYCKKQVNPKSFVFNN